MPSGFSSFKSKVDKLDVSKMLVNAIQNIDNSDLFQRKLTATQKLMILKKTC